MAGASPQLTPSASRRYGPPMEFRFEFDPREAAAFVRGLDARQELVYRLAIRGICPKCRSDRAFTRRTEELVAQFRIDTAAVLKDAAALGDWLEAKAASR
jgi:hypothetical protein